MNDFLKFFAKKVQHYPMHMEIRYNKTEDWVIHIWKKGCASDYPAEYCSNGDACIFFENDPDLEYLCAQAHVALKDFLIKYEGGY